MKLKLFSICVLTLSLFSCTTNKGNNIDSNETSESSLNVTTENTSNLTIPFEGLTIIPIKQHEYYLDWGRKINFDMILVLKNDPGKALMFDNDVNYLSLAPLIYFIEKVQFNFDLSDWMMILNTCNSFKT
ncbi:MAG: hypothetical protein K2H44_04645 [Muribaculaceae bacterium]|nr:hypothetical protein [Muribaculaceae bacterium]